MFAVSTLSSLVILSVEFDAPARALKWLDNANITTAAEYANAKDALKWAALTYVIAALSSIAMFVYYIMIYTSRSRDRASLIKCFGLRKLKLNFFITIIKETKFS